MNYLILLYKSIKMTKKIEKKKIFKYNNKFIKNQKPIRLYVVILPPGGESP